MIYHINPCWKGRELVVSDMTPGAALAALREGMRVVDINGKPLGTATAIHQVDTTGEIAHFTVQHGLFGRKHKPVPAHLIKQITGDVATLKFSAAEFKELRDREDRV